MKQYNVTGMSCAACSAHVEKAVRQVAGVESVTVNLLTNSMSVEGTASDSDVVAAVTKAGYGAVPRGGGAGKNQANGSAAGSDAAAGTAGGSAYSAEEEALLDRETPKLKRRLIASLCILTPLMYLSMGGVMWGWPLPAFLEHNPAGIGVVQALLTGLVMVVNQKFFINGFVSLYHRAPNMDTLVALGAAASFGYSTYALLAITVQQAQGNMEAAHHLLHEFYFESAAMILALITVGKMLEARSKGKTTDALKSLMRLSPKTATVVRGGREETVAIEEVLVDDVFVVRPGESIPVDGIVLEGNSAVDEAALTGESIPVDKEPGSQVSAATINQSGFLRCRASRVGENTTLSQIIRMVSDAAATKAPIAKVADRVSGVFVPAVIAIAAVTIIGWLLAGQTVGFALARGISVLVISCPCALGLATPVAIMVGNGASARHGILFKTAVSLEETGKTELIALDKTGTITQGQPAVTDVLPAAGSTEARLIAQAYALEQKSEHPLARAVLSYAEKLGLEVPAVTDFAAAPGNGLTGRLDQTALAGGNLKFIETIADVPAEMREAAETLAQQGKTPLFFAADGALAGIIAVADIIKEDSAQAIRQLQRMGIRTVMLTGDNQRTAEAIGSQVGVDQVIAGVLPSGKESVIRDLQRLGRVAMVGDGINDAPALTRADIGIAIGAGTDVAIDAADVVLMHSRLTDVAAAIRLSRAVLKNIHENLFWAFFYNAVGIPLAAGIFIPIFGWRLNPMFGAAAMSLSSFCVVTNALRLNLFSVYDDRRDHKIKRKRKEVKTMERTLNITGMMCAHCEANVKKCLEALPAVAEAVVSKDSGTAVVTLSAEVANGELKKAVEDQGYEVTDIK